MSPIGFRHDITALVALRELATAACETVETADFTSLMIPAKDGLRVLEGDPRVRDIEELQCAMSDGPMFEALRTGRICRIPSTRSSPSWPTLREVCRRHGVMSVAALPVIVDGFAVAILNLYSCDYHAFGPDETRTAQRLAGQASHAIAGAIRSAEAQIDRTATQ